MRRAEDTYFPSTKAKKAQVLQEMPYKRSLVSVMQLFQVGGGCPSLWIGIVGKLNVPPASAAHLDQFYNVVFAQVDFPGRQGHVVSQHNVPVTTPVVSTSANAILDKKKARFANFETWRQTVFHLRGPLGGKKVYLFIGVLG